MSKSTARFPRSIRIEAPSADVWAAIVDVEAWPAWATQFRRLERLEASPLAVGSRVRVAPKGMPSAVWQVTEYEEGLSFTWAASLFPGVRLTGGHTVAADGGAARAGHGCCSRSSRSNNMTCEDHTVPSEIRAAVDEEQPRCASATWCRCGRARWCDA